MSETVVEYRSRTPHHLSAETLEKLDSSLIDEAQTLWTKLKEVCGLPEELVDLLAAIRHKVYKLGLGGGHTRIEGQAIEQAKLEQRRENLSDPINQENAEEFAERCRRIRTKIALTLLGQIEERVLEKELGITLGKYGKLDLEQALTQVDPKKGVLRQPIISQTPVNELLNIVALAEDAEYRDNEICQRARRIAGEHLIRRLVTGNPELIKVASKFFRLRHYQAILEQMPDTLADGRIGGKSAGILLAYAALEQETPDFDRTFAEQHRMRQEQLKHKLANIGSLEVNHSTFIGSGIFERFMSHKANNSTLANAALLKTYYLGNGDRPELEDLKQMHTDLQANVMQATFPREIERRFYALFKKLHGKPIIVRSSSELEDRLGAAFAGKYESVELSNSGDFNTDYSLFLQAILKVYSSVFSQDVHEYRAQHALLLEDEEMGVLIQELNGQVHAQYFYPDFAAVAMSHATQSIGHDPTRGAMTLVAGLGEEAVQTGGRFTMFAAPRAKFDNKQRQSAMIVINLETGQKNRKSTKDLLNDKALSDAVAGYGSENSSLALDNNMVAEELALFMEYHVQKLKHQLMYNVDCEFTIEKVKSRWQVKLVQCRPQNIPETLQPTRVPENVRKERKLLVGEKNVNAGCYENVRYLFYVDPRVFEKLEAKERLAISRYLARLNDIFKRDTKKKAQYLVIVPRRWGSKDEGSGLPANFADFSNAAGVMEVIDGLSSPSFGTHFWQDFMDQEMLGGSFREEGINKKFFSETQHLSDLPEMPEALKPYVKMIDVNQAWEAQTGQKSELGWRVHVAQDNAHTLDQTRPASVYVAEYGRDLPEKVLTK